MARGAVEAGDGAAEGLARERAELGKHDGEKQAAATTSPEQRETTRSHGHSLQRCRVTLQGQWCLCVRYLYWYEEEDICTGRALSARTLGQLGDQARYGNYYHVVLFRLVTQASVVCVA